VEKSLVPRRLATVAVVESRMQSVHYPELSTRWTLEGRGAPWIRFEWFDEGSLDELARGLRSSRFSALLVASGALQLHAIAVALNSSEFASEIQAQVKRGMGLVVMQTFAAPGRRLLEFLPPGMNVWAVPNEAAAAIAPNYSSSFEQKIAATLSALEGHLLPEIPLPSERAVIATLKGEEGDYQQVAARLPSGEPIVIASRGSRGRVYVSTAPLDQMGSHALHAMLVRAVRANGMLLIRQTPPASAVEEREYLDWLAAKPSSTHLCEVLMVPGSQEALNIGEGTLACFGHIVFASPWSWESMPRISRHDLLLRLENGGSITALVRTSSGETHWLSLAGATRAIETARRYARWLSTHGEDVVDSPLLVIRAATRVNAALRTAVSDWDDVPPLVRPEFARSLFEAALLGRLCGRKRDNVDGLLVPTAALLSACRDLGVTLDSSTALVNWMRRSLVSASPASVLQAATWVPELRREGIVAQLVESTLVDKSTPRDLEVHALGLAAFSGVCDCSVETTEQKIVALLADANLDILAKATLAETVLSAADECTAGDSARAHRLRIAVRTTASDVVAVADERNTTQSSEVTMLAFAAALRLESHARLGFKRAGPLLFEENPSAVVEVIASAEAERLSLETKRRVLARELDDSQVRLARVRRAGQLLFLFALLLMAGVLVLLFVLFSRAIAAFWDSNALGKDLVLLALPVAIGAAAYLIRRLLSPAGFVPRWLGGDE